MMLTAIATNIRPLQGKALGEKFTISPSKNPSQEKQIPNSPIDLSSGPQINYRISYIVCKIQAWKRNPRLLSKLTFRLNCDFCDFCDGHDGSMMLTAIATNITPLKGRSSIENLSFQPKK
jgi:hypothetical protein